MRLWIIEENSENGANGQDISKRLAMLARAARGPRDLTRWSTILFGSPPPTHFGVPALRVMGSALLFC